MRKLLFVGDAACGSGFGRATSAILKHMLPTWDAACIGINYRGDPHTEPYRIYPAWVGGDALGIKRVREIAEVENPSLIVLQTNPWNVPHYMRELERLRSVVPVVGIIAVEGKNCVGSDLNKLSRAIFWNKFSENEARAGGMLIPSGIVPLGVDLELFKPGDKRRARASLGFNDELQRSFIVLNVNRNQNRKKLDLSVQYFAEWIKRSARIDAYLMFHALPGSVRSCNLEQLANYYGVANRVIVSEPKNIFKGAPDESVVRLYQAADVLLSTTLGEGHGLTAMEAMACGVPCILPDFSAFGEWAKGAAWLVPCDHEYVMPDVNNMIGGSPHKEATIGALNTFYASPGVRETHRAAGRACVEQPRYRWENIAARFAEEIETCA